MRILPRSIAARLALYFVAAVGGAQILAFAFFMHETSRVDRTVIRLRLGEQVETLVRLLDVLPPDAGAKALEAFDTPRHHFAIDANPSLWPGRLDADTERLADRMHERIGDAISEVRLASDDSHAEAGDSGQTTLLLSVHLRDGRWLNASLRSSNRRPSWMRIGLYQIAASLLAVLAVVVLSRQGIVRPLTELTDQARRVGRDLDVPELPEHGPEELKALTAAFNAMQGRLRNFVADRTRMLAAIGHDLRTPIASLWLRAEMIEEEPPREAMIATLRQMSEMVDATLAFAKAEGGQPRWQTVDIAELARAVVDEHRELDEDVSFAGPSSFMLEGDPAMLRRAIDNLITNAVRYGTSARVSLIAERGDPMLRVEDDGPGIPANMQEEVLKPFTRLDRSRGDDTHGVGLGLAVVQSAIRVHKGKLGFRNGLTNGLVVEIVLPGNQRTED